MNYNYNNYRGGSRAGSRGGGKKQVYVAKGQSSSSPSSAESSVTHDRHVGNYDSSNDYQSRRRGGLFHDAGDGSGVKSVSSQSDRMSASDCSPEQFTPSPSSAEVSSRMQNIGLVDASPHTADCSLDQFQSSSYGSNLDSHFPPLSLSDGRGKKSSVKGIQREQTADASRESRKKSESSNMIGSGSRNGQASYKNTYSRNILGNSPNMHPGVDSAIGHGWTSHEKTYSWGKNSNSQTLQPGVDSSIGHDQNSQERTHSRGKYGNSQILQPGVDSSIGHDQNSQERTHSRGKYGNSQIMHPVVDSGIKHGQASHEKTYSGAKLDNSQHPHTGLPFDICSVKTVFSLKTPLHLRNKEKRNENRHAGGQKSINVLRPGMVHLSGYLSLSEQIRITEKCRKLGLGPGGFYQPGYSDGAKLCLKMMCLGKNWDPQTSRYNDVRPDDGAKPPSIPDDFYELVQRAIQDSHAHLKKQSDVKNVEHILPSMTPDICIVNFYNNSGRLGLHQDKDESQESLRRELPVVSFSIGDSAEFVYGDSRDIEKAEKVVLESGDVLIFGGKSRHVFHGVTTIKPDTASKVLLEETNMKAGRLNLTFRHY